MTTPKRALVTGAGGFIGSNLTRRLLADGHAVSAVERPNSDGRRLDGVDVSRHSIDLRDRDAVARLIDDTRPDWVYHLGAHGGYSWQTDPRGILESNLLGTVNIVDACLTAEIEAFVNAGSSSEYGYTVGAPTEAQAPEPNSDYAFAKAAATLYAGYAGRRSGGRFATLRLYSVYGPREDARRLIPALIAHGLRGELPLLVNPDVARDFVYIDDVLDAFIEVSTREAVEPGAIYNIGTGRQTTIREIVEIARIELGIEEIPQWGSMPDRHWDTGTWVADSSKAARELGWQPKTSLESGFRRTVQWIRENPVAATER